jgi:hypothetical protein
VPLGLYYYTFSMGTSTSKLSGVGDLEGDFYPVLGPSSE